MKKQKISLPMSLVFPEEKCLQALLNFFVQMDVGRVSGVVEEAENSDHGELSDRGVYKVDVAFWQLFGEEDSQLCFCFFMLWTKRGESMYGICHGH